MEVFVVMHVSNLRFFNQLTEEENSLHLLLSNESPEVTQ